MKKVQILSEKGNKYEIPGKSINWSKIPIYPECNTLDLFDYFDFSNVTPLKIIFLIENTTDIGLGVYIEERNKVLKRRLSSSNILSYSGPALETKNLSLGRDIKAVISLSQIIDLEEDEEKRCKNYPRTDWHNKNLTFLDYNACDMEYAYQYLKKHYNLTPFWATNNISEVTALKVIDRENRPVTGEYVDGTITSPCYHPCLTTKVQFSISSYQPLCVKLSFRFLVRS